MVRIVTEPVHDHGSILPLSGHVALLLVLLDLTRDHLHLPDQGLNMWDIFILILRRFIVTYDNFICEEGLV